MKMRSSQGYWQQEINSYHIQPEHELLVGFFTQIRLSLIDLVHEDAFWSRILATKRDSYHIQPEHELFSLDK